MDGVQFEKTRNGLRLRLTAANGGWASLELTESEWATFVTMGSRFIGLPDPWKG